MNISSETLKVILIIISAIIAIIVPVVSYYVIAFIRELKRDKIKGERKAAMHYHRVNATYYAISTNKNGFDTERFKVIYQQRLKELIDEDEIFKD